MRTVLPAERTIRLISLAPPDGAASAVAADRHRWRRRDGETADAFEARVLAEIGADKRVVFFPWP